MTIRRHATARRSLAVAMTVGLLLGPVLSWPAGAQSPGEEIGHGSWRGTLFESDERTPIAGARLTAVSTRSGKEYTGYVTSKDGSFLIDGLPAGSYDLAIDFGQGVFVLDQSINFTPNESLSDSYAVQPQHPASHTIANRPAAKGSARSISAAASRSLFWTSTGGKVLIGVLVAGAAAVLYNNLNDTRGSPSSP